MSFSEQIKARTHSTARLAKADELDSIMDYYSGLIESMRDAEFKTAT